MFEKINLGLIFGLVYLIGGSVALYLSFKGHYNQEHIAVALIISPIIALIINRKNNTN